MVKPWALRSYAVCTIGDEDNRLETDVRCTIRWGSPNSVRERERELLNGCPSTAAIMASSLTCVRTVHG